MRHRDTSGICAVGFVVLVGVLVMADQAKQVVEQEREIKQAEVPAAALATLTKLAGGAVLSEFAEEIEDGRKFYEGSWKGPDGKIDALVTEAGDFVELEESAPAAKVPNAARMEAEKQAGKDVALAWEKKTTVMYEVHFTKEGKGHEILLTPDGRIVKQEAEEKQEQAEDDK